MFSKKTRRSHKNCNSKKNIRRFKKTHKKLHRKYHSKRHKTPHSKRLTYFGGRDIPQSNQIFDTESPRQRQPQPQPEPFDYIDNLEPPDSPLTSRTVCNYINGILNSMPEQNIDDAKDNVYRLLNSIMDVDFLNNELNNKIIRFNITNITQRANSLYYYECVIVNNYPSTGNGTENTLYIQLINNNGNWTFEEH